MNIDPNDAGGAPAAGAEATEDRTDDRYIVPGLSRGLAVLQLFSRSNSDLTLSEIADGIGLSRSAAFRLVYTLEAEGFLKRPSGTRRYQLTPRVLTLGFGYLHAQPLTAIAQPLLEKLSQLTRLSAHLVVLDGCNCVYVARAVCDAAMVSNLQIGARFPAHVTASGRVLLADLDDLHLRRVFSALARECRVVPPPKSIAVLTATARDDRVRLYVYGHAVFDPMVVSLAYPVRDASGNVVAAINVVGVEQLIEAQGGALALSRVVATAAAEMSALLGFGGPRIAN